MVEMSSLILNSSFFVRLTLERCLVIELEPKRDQEFSLEGVKYTNIKVRKMCLVVGRQVWDQNLLILFVLVLFFL